MSLSVKKSNIIIMLILFFTAALLFILPYLQIREQESRIEIYGTIMAISETIKSNPKETGKVVQRIEYLDIEYEYNEKIYMQHSQVNGHAF